MAEHAPPTKWPRLDDGTGPEKQGPPEKYKELWFDDGSIVIQCPTASFCVHSSLLSIHSEVFRDMFTVGTPSKGDMVGDVPVVHVSDRAEDMYHFLRILYFPKDVPELTDSEDVKLAISLLALSTKYAAERLRQDIVTHFCALFPSTLAAFQTTCDDLDLTLADLVRVTEVGIKYNMPQILPTVYFMICRGWDADEIFDPEGIYDDNDRSVVRLPPEAVLPLARAPSRILHLRRQYFERYMRDFPIRCMKNQHCEISLHKAFMSYYTWRSGTPYDGQRGFEMDFDFFDPTGSSMQAVNGYLLDTVCQYCRKEWEDVERTGREEAWKVLPMCFKLAPWEELFA